MVLTAQRTEINSSNVLQYNTNTIQKNYLKNLVLQKYVNPILGTPR